MQSTFHLLPLTLEATAAITSRRFVTLAGVLATAITTSFGVSRSDAANGDLFTADVFGVATLETGGIIAVNNKVGSDATGRAVAVTPGVVKTAVIAGGAAGALTVTGLAATDTLLSVTRFDVAPDAGVLHQAVIAGGAAGNHTVTGILTTDTLVSVLHFNVAADTGTEASGNKIDAIADLTGEFTISSADTIENAGHMATSNDFLLVSYRRPSTTGNQVQAVSDLTSEFTISAADTITNAGHTNTTGDTLLVTYQQHKPIGGIALSAAGASGQFVQVLLLPQI